MQSFFTTYMSATEKGSNRGGCALLDEDQLRNKRRWTTDSEAAFNKLSIVHKIVHNVRQRFAHTYFTDICEIYHVNGTSIFTDIGKMLDRRERLVQKEVEIINESVINDYFDRGKLFIDICKGLKSDLDVSRELTCEMTDVLGFFLDQNDDDNFIPAIAPFEQVKGIIAFMLYGIRQHTVTNEQDLFVPQPCILKPYYCKNGMIWVSSILLCEPCQLSIYRDGYRSQGMMYSYLKCLNLAGVSFTIITSALSNLAVIRGDIEATGFQQICNIINNFILKDKIEIDRFSIPIETRAFKQFIEFTKYLSDKYNIKINYKRLIISIFLRAPKVFDRTKNIMIKVYNDEFITDTELSDLRRFGVAQIVKSKNSYNLIRMNAADEDLEDTDPDPESDQDGNLEDETDPTEEGDDTPTDDDPATDDGGTDDEATDEDGEVEDEPEPEPVDDRIKEVDKSGIEFELSSGNLTFAEYILRERIIRKLNKLLADPGDVPTEQVEYLKHFRDHWLYLVSINTLMEVATQINIEGV